MIKLVRRVRAALFGVRVGDVVRDRYDNVTKTVEAIDKRGRVSLVWFEGGALCRGSSPSKIVSFVS